jgi:DNA invertase Pin-like site-specific DNA recombinase
MHPKIKSKQLEKIAYLYLRQSTQKQVQANQESPRVQLQLKDKLYQLGFTKVDVVNKDLGKSGSGYATREGFGKILSDVCHNRVGAVASWEASRLARNNYEWQNLIRFCQITETLVIDESGVYDPCNIDDIAMLGIKATMCEYELNIIAKRARAGVLEKAKRGELYTVIVAGYYLTDDGKYEMVADARIRQTLHLVFDKFDELGSAHQVLTWFQEEKVDVPKVRYHDGKRIIIWELPSYSNIINILTNPTYAGTYVYGRTKTHTFIDENQPKKSKGHPLAIKDWQVMIPNHHHGYISWEKYLKNQDQLQDNCNNYRPNSKGASKMGSSLLVGLLHCGHCGRKLRVKYSGSNSKSIRYFCRGSYDTTGYLENCYSIAGKKIEQAVVREVLQVIQPAAIKAAIAVEEQLSASSSEKEKRLELALTQVRYEAERRERQFNAVEPENQLVIRELQSQWNKALAELERLEQALKMEKENHPSIDESQCQKLYALANDLPQLWNLPSTDERTKKRIIRTLVDSIIAKTESDNDWDIFTIHWTGGVHSEIRLKRNKRGEYEHYTSKEALEIIKELSVITDDGNIARILNRCGLKTATGKNWNTSRVRWTRQNNQIAAFCKEENENSDVLNLRQAANILKLTPDTVRRLIKTGLIKGKQVVMHAPWIIHKSELEKTTVIDAVQSIKKKGTIENQLNQQQLDFS